MALTYDHANSIAHNMTVDLKYARMFRVYRCMVDMATLEAAYRKHELYITDDNDPYPGKIERFEQFAMVTPPEKIYAPVIQFVNTDRGVIARFMEGRHRHKVLRDAGVSEMTACTWSRKSCWFGLQSGIITKWIDDPGYIRPVKARIAA